MSRRSQPREEESNFQIRPSFESKFRPGAVKEAIHTVLNEVLTGKAYESEQVGDWSKEIADSIKQRIKEMGYERYKVKIKCTFWVTKLNVGTALIGS